MSDLREQLDDLGWFDPQGGVLRVPALVKGRIVRPPPVDRSSIERAFATADPDATTCRVPGAIALREVDRDGRRHYQVVPELSPADLIEADPDRLVAELYNMPHRETMAFLEQVGAAVLDQGDLLAEVADLASRTSEHPRAFVDTDFAALPMLFDPEVGRQMVDADLSIHGIAGHRFLDGWVEVPASVMPGPAQVIGAELVAEPHSHGPRMRAMPTRQLHITAGNAPLIPVLSMMRALWTKSAATVKLPFGATLLGSMFGLVLQDFAPDHPVTRALSVVYWPGGDETYERVLLAPGAFDRIVVWGAPQAVKSVRSRAALTKVVCFNPRFGASLVGKEALSNLSVAAPAAVMDSMIQNQKACIAAQVHYVEGDRNDALRWAEAVRDGLARWDEHAPQQLTPWQRGQLKRLRRGALLEAPWNVNSTGKELGSAAVVVDENFDVRAHPMCRLVAVRPVARLEDVLAELTPAVSTVGVYPESRRMELADRIAARGVSQIQPLGEAGRTFPGMAHDGMMVLSELVDWKNA